MAFAKHAAAAVMLIASTFGGTVSARAEEVTQIHATLNGLSRADLAGPSPRFLAMLERWFPKYTEQGPCGPGADLISSDAVCEWRAPGANTSGAILPDMFVSMSRRKLDSVVFWGEMPLNTRNWQCKRVLNREVSTICISLVVPAEQRTRLIADWEALLARIAPGA